MSATVKFYPSKPYRNGKLKESEVPVVAKVTFSRKQRFEVSTKLRVIPTHWNFDAQEVKRGAEASRTNQRLAQLKAHLLNLCEHHRGNFAELKAIAQQGETVEEKKSLASLFKAFLSYQEKETDPLTLKGYKTLEKYFEKFAHLPFESLDWNFFDAWKDLIYSQGLQDSTASKYTDRLRTFLAWAKKRGNPVTDHFEGFTIDAVRKPAITLRLSELEALETAILPFGPGIGRDILCFEARTGQRISDIKRFDQRDYFDYRWTFYQKKGSKAKKITIPFKGYCAPALMILAKHKFEMPAYSEQTINGWIKEAGELVGIDQLVEDITDVRGKRTIKLVPKWQMLSTHTGRKTFITLGLQFMKAKIVKDLAGIEKWDTLKHYEAESETEVTERALEEMAEKISEQREAV